MSLEALKIAFFQSRSYAVVGASKDKTKFGTQLLQWYLARDMDITPVHPKETELEGVATIKSIDELPSPSTTSISIVTPAKITLDILKKAKELDVPALWIQPGAADSTVLDYIKDNNMADKVVYGGEACVLTEGDRYRVRSTAL
ncbi:CoA-binding protein [Rhodocollybia butyracea]|uniref:CoA-binding protein n=1 Tax=Rhodocollybia butyracea TaxID=206335 RepID=A0A9P5PDG3_9AGAR|nr:CoA-binding protein [Rhodocollybia butyracea]KAF9064722.1 CoA-binding protein [Rhodocollybia butyracea]